MWVLFMMLHIVFPTLDMHETGLCDDLNKVVDHLVHVVLLIILHRMSLTFCSV